MRGVIERNVPSEVASDGYRGTLFKRGSSINKDGSIISPGDITCSVYIQYVSIMYVKGSLNVYYYCHAYVHLWDTLA